MDITRRQFLAGIGALSVCMSSSADLMQALLGESQDVPFRKASKVVVIRDPAVLDNGQPVPEVVSSMLREGLENLLSCEASKGVRELFGKAKQVGIKINCLGGKPLATRKELAYALASLIVSEVGDDCVVTIWDRSENELRKAGYEIVRKGQIRCLATDSRGIGYEPFVREFGAVGSKFSRLLTDLCDSAVSLAVLKDHGIAGISGCMKNFYGAIHNPNKYHPNGCDPYVADLFGSEIIMGKHKLSIVDGLVGIYNGGPGYKPKYRWDFKGLILGTDAVAVDRICLNLIEAKRQQMGTRSLKDEDRFPQYIFTAGSRAVGCSDISKIDLVEVDRGM